MIKMQTALLILTVFIACLYFSAKRKNDINHKLFSSMLIMGSVNLTFDIVTVYTVNHLEEVSPVVNRVCHDIFIGGLLGEELGEGEEAFFSLFHDFCFFNIPIYQCHYCTGNAGKSEISKLPICDTGGVFTDVNFWKIRLS